MKTTGSDQGKIMYVLVEEEKAIREEWLRIASAKDIPLMTYPDEDWFMADLRKGIFRGNERFYLDQDFGRERGVGLRLSREIKRCLPGAYTSLVTAYPKFMFRREITAGWINDVYGKYPSPFDNQPYTEFEKKYEREVWVPLCGVSVEYS